MDNAVDALKMAFAVLVFIIALTTSMIAFGQAKEASDHVFYMTDKTNFYEYLDEEKDDGRAKGRLVSSETIVPTLYRYYKENFNVIIIPKDGNLIDTVNNKLAKARYGSSTTDSKVRKAVVFNLEEEIKYYNKDYRYAPWLGNANIDTKKRVDIELSGKSEKINQVEYDPQMKVEYDPQLGDGLLKYMEGKVFREYFIEQRYSGKEIRASDDEALDVVKGNTKIWIVYEEE